LLSGGCPRVAGARSGGDETTGVGGVGDRADEGRVRVLHAVIGVDGGRMVGHGPGAERAAMAVVEAPAVEIAVLVLLLAGRVEGEQRREVEVSSAVMVGCLLRRAGRGRVEGGHRRDVVPPAVDAAVHLPGAVVVVHGSHAAQHAEIIEAATVHVFQVSRHRIETGAEHRHEVAPPAIDGAVAVLVVVLDAHDPDDQHAALFAEEEVAGAARRVVGGVVERFVSPVADAVRAAAGRGGVEQHGHDAERWY